MSEVPLYASSQPSASPQSGTKLPFSGPLSELALTRIRRLAVQINATEKADFLPL